MSRFIFDTEWTDLLQGCREWVRLEVYEGIVEYARTGTPPKLGTQAGAVLRCIIREMERESRPLAADDNMRLSRQQQPSAIDAAARDERSPLRSASAAECGALHAQPEEATAEGSRARVISSVYNYSLGDKEKKKNTAKKDKAASSVPDSLFVRFFSLYGMRVDEAKVLREWNKLSAEDRQKAIDYLPAYFRAKPDKRYRRYPLQYLKTRMWQNELPGMEPAAKASAKEQQRKFEQESIRRSLEEMSEKPPTEEEKRQKRRRQLLGYIRAVKENPKSFMRDILLKVKEKGELRELGIEWSP